jgi:magnesium chelatase family protein
VNAQMDARMLGEHVRVEARGEELLRQACERGLLSARGHARVLRVARTLADLDASAGVRARDVGAALALRPDVALSEARVA